VHSQLQSQAQAQAQSCGASSRPSTACLQTACPRKGRVRRGAFSICWQWWSPGRCDTAVAAPYRRGADAKRLLSRPGTVLSELAGNVIVVEDPVTSDVSSTKLREQVGQGQAIARTLQHRRNSYSCLT